MIFCRWIKKNYRMLLGRIKNVNFIYLMFIDEIEEELVFLIEV